MNDYLKNQTIEYFTEIVTDAHNQGKLKIEGGSQYKGKMPTFIECFFDEKQKNWFCKFKADGNLELTYAMKEGDILMAINLRNARSR